jgi:hypothetical protein
MPPRLTPAEHRTSSELGLRRDLPPGPTRLLAALMRQGLGTEAVPAAAKVCVALDMMAPAGIAHGQVEGEERGPALAA